MQPPRLQPEWMMSVKIRVNRGAGPPSAAVFINERTLPSRPRRIPELRGKNASRARAPADAFVCPERFAATATPARPGVRAHTCRASCPPRPNSLRFRMTPAPRRDRSSPLQRTNRNPPTSQKPPRANAQTSHLHNFFPSASRRKKAGAEPFVFPPGTPEHEGFRRARAGGR